MHAGDPRLDLVYRDGLILAGKVVVRGQEEHAVAFLRWGVASSWCVRHGMLQSSDDDEPATESKNLEVMRKFSEQYAKR